MLLQIPLVYTLVECEAAGCALRSFSYRNSYVRAPISNFWGYGSRLEVTDTPLYMESIVQKWTGNGESPISRLNVNIL